MLQAMLSRARLCDTVEPSTASVYPTGYAFRSAQWSSRQGSDVEKSRRNEPAQLPPRVKEVMTI